MNERIISRFRKVAIAEGISYLMLFVISMPLKYLANILWPNQVIGLIHGVLFMAYMLLAIPLFTKLKWPFKRMLLVIIASLLPFGTFWLEKRYLRDQKG